MRPNAPNLPPALPAVVPPQALPPAAAQRALFAAITFAHASELLQLLKEALAAGASFNARNAQNHDVFTLAVIHDRPHALGTLLALGAVLPDVQDDGMDLLMRAAMLDHPACCDELIRLANFDLELTDHEGRTALFFAAQHGSVLSARILLDAGAKAGESSYELGPETLQSIFGLNHRLDGKQVTPLMIATALGDGVVVDLLLAEGAQANDGDFPPLHLAADAHDPDMIERLIDGGAEVAASLDWNADNPLETATRSNAPMNCFYPLAANFPFNEADAIDQEQLLAGAVKAARSDVLALFLAHGAEPDERSADQTSVWDLAATTPNAADVGAQRRLDLLTTCRASRWADVEQGPENAILAFHVVATASNSAAAVASQGLYPSLLQGLQTELLAKPPGADWSGTRQSALYAAGLYLAQDEPAAMAVDANPALQQRPLEPTPDLEWQYRTDTGIAAQRSWLKASASALVEQNTASLRQALSLNFFRQMANQCPDNTRLDAFIKTHLTATTGLPDVVIELIASSWLNSPEAARQLREGVLSAEQEENFIVQPMLARLTHGIEKKLPQVQNAQSALWMVDLKRISEERMTVRIFANNPLAWLMRNEQRHDLRPVDIDALSATLAMELGLPSEACDIIAKGWAVVVATLAQDRRVVSPDALWRLAAVGLSPVIANAIVINDNLVLPQMVRQLAELWCVQQSGPLQGRSRMRAPAGAPAAGPVIEPVVEQAAERAAPPAAGGPTTPEAPPDVPPSPATNPTTPEEMPTHSWTPARVAQQDPPPRPQVGRKRPADTETGPRKEARHQ